MREIKFRAWEKNLKEMITVSTIEFSKEMINTDSLWRYFHEVELMQFTGLKDKKGNEIYEGDIYLYRYYGGNKTYLVEYDKDRGGFFPFATDDGCGCCAGDVVFNPEKDGEVVGNVFKNPELLEEKD